MKAAVFHRKGELRVEEHVEPKVEGPDDVIIEVEACGVCGTDLQILNVPPGHPATPGVILGHEFAGHAVAIGPNVRDLQIGQRVVVDPDPKCGKCQFCRSGRPANCINIVALGTFADGALARFTRAPASSVYAIASGVPAPVASLIEPLACVVNGTNRANPRPGDSAVVFGAGPIGCLFTCLLRAAGASPVIVVEPSAVRQRVAKEVGAHHVLSPDEFKLRRVELLPFGADVLIDAVGSLFANAIEHAALGGRIVLFGQNANALPAIKQYTITERSLSVFGSYITTFTFPTAIRLVEQKLLPLERIVSRVISLVDVHDGLALLRTGEATKVVVIP
jgi:threonine dehydrogenase-like Zn-dependent dehydrogenase